MIYGMYRLGPRAVRSVRRPLKTNVPQYETRQQFADNLLWNVLMEGALSAISVTDRDFIDERAARSRPSRRFCPYNHARTRKTNRL